MELKYNKELLYDMYINKEYSMSKIASMYGISTMTVRAWLNKNEIKTKLSTQNIYKELKTTEFSSTQKSLLVGSILGDGSITIGNDCINARFVERHCEEQKNYLLWKMNILKPFTKSKVVKSDGKEHIISDVKCLTSNSYMFSTISHNYLTELRSLFYKDNIKIIPQNLNDFVNGLVMAVWICDDGSLSYIKKSGTYRMDLHTESFTYKENLFLCRDILSPYFTEAFIINSRQYKSGEAFYLCISGKDKVLKIVNSIKQFIPECMIYKFKDYIT